ncbi:hypothetical protein BCR44DRAFT_34753 [Catenaria anguillulae PL171]|uniref:Putative gamma-glutamylcyclotransferase n=1 Tax=Catenaria anguillulae PL171 TaxID=765915 RepID=A0A1Y2I210_9FUNG|nr:hypothetical protein BCR44DRAFT_34753 [Catenaria anguillulae PL171]
MSHQGQQEKSILVFVYGSLMHPEVWRRVTGAATADERKAYPAMIQGYVRRAVTDASAFYPAIRATGNPDDKVYGLAIEVEGEYVKGVTARLDQYETAMYSRIQVPITLLSTRTDAAGGTLPPSIRADERIMWEPPATMRGTEPVLANTYVWAAEMTRLHPTLDWDYEAFVQKQFGMFEEDMHKQRLAN